MLKKSAIIAGALLVIAAVALGAIHWKTKADPLQVLVIYKNGTDSYYDTLQHLNQTLVVHTRIDHAAWPVSEKKLDGYDAVYVDRALANLDESADLSDKLTRYVDEGGMLFAENEFHSVLPKELIGAEKFVEVEKLPETLSYPESDKNAAGLQTIIKQFHQDMIASYTPERLADVPLGMGVVPSTAASLAQAEDGTALYTLNRYGKGYVLFCSGLLPNSDFVTGFDMQPRVGDEQPYFNFMFATGNYQLRNEFLAFLSKEKLGYAVSKVLGTNGRPALAWQNHFEALASIKDQGMEKWIDYLKTYDQIPSYSLVRETYDWGVWKEGLAYYPNGGSSEQPSFQGETVHSQYSSGNIVHYDSGEAFSMEPYPEYKSLSWEITLPYRTYADLADVNGDNLPDMIAGSGGGQVAFYPGMQRDGSWGLGTAEPLLLENGDSLQTEGYASPVFAELNGDGEPDLIIGAGDGRISGYLNNGDFRFRETTLNIPAASAGAYAAPAVGDMNGDGVSDLVIGGGDGRVVYHVGTLEGERLLFAPAGITIRESTGEKDDQFAAPRITDIDGNGIADLLVGGNGGYIRKYEAESDASGIVALADKGYLEGNSYNPHGDHRLWGGRNAVPIAGDVNGDGLTDLVVGQLIFGYPIAIDDPAFPYRAELEKSLEYAKQHYIDIQPHLFFHSYESAETEREEIELHRKTFESYGLPWVPTGTNQHTWRVNNLDPVQTVREELEAGIWWNSGFRPPANPYEPSLAGEYLWTMPFLLADKDGVEPFIIANPSPDLSLFENAYASYAALDMPITHFYHMEYAILEPESEAGYAKKVQFLDQFRDQNDYNFMTEDQMFRSVMAAYQADSSLGTPFFSNVWNTISNRLRTKQELNVTVQTNGLQDMDWKSQPDPKLQELIDSYLPAVGYKVELGSKYAGYIPVTDAPIAMYRQSVLYFGGDADAKITIEPAYPNQPRIERVNVPVTIERNGSNARLDLQGQGLQQVKLYAPNGLEVHSEGWKIEEDNEKQHYVLTRFGDATTLEVTFK